MSGMFPQEQRKQIAEQLDKNLGPEYLSVRAGYGSTQLTYVEGWLIISLANKIFGFDGWSSEIKGFTEEYRDMNDGKISVGYTCCCRITLRNGTYKEDVGFGSADGQKTKGLAIEKAKKEASTDALKRALRQFGNALGNCCYDKEFLKQIHQKPLAGSRKLLRKRDLAVQNEDPSMSFSQEPSDL